MLLVRGWPGLINTSTTVLNLTVLFILPFGMDDLSNIYLIWLIKKEIKVTIDYFPWQM
jgi:hypothetical protein